MVKALMPSATATPQPRGVFRNLNVKIYFSWEIGIKSGGKRVRPKAVRFSPDSSLRAAPSGQSPQPAKILTIRTSWLAQSFCRLPHNPPCCCFFSVTLFATHAHLAHCFFSFLKKINKPIHPQAKKTFALQPPPPCCTCARKKQLKAIIHNV